MIFIIFDLCFEGEIQHTFQIEMVNRFTCFDFEGEGIRLETEFPNLGPTKKFDWFEELRVWMLASVLLESRS
jgi:hypothetical protein